MSGALFVIMLRSSGLIARPDQMEAEAGLVRRLHRFRNADGGFYKYKGAPSSPLLSRICNAAILLALGGVRAAGRPRGWMEKNPLLDASAEVGLRRVLRESEMFCATAPSTRNDELEMDLVVFSPLMVAHACGLESVDRRLRRLLGNIAFALRLPGLLYISRMLLHRFVEAVLPAAMILMAGLKPGGSHSARSRRLASLIRSTQDETGGWEIGSLITMLNVMALARSGCPADDPALVKAHEFLLRKFFRQEDDGASFDFATGVVLNTGYGLDSLVRAGASLDAGEPAAQALSCLLRMQTSEGGWSFGSNMPRDVESDSTAHVLRSFRAIAGKSDEPAPGLVRDAMERGAASMLRRQHRRGGFSCYKRPVFDGHRGSSCVVEQVFLDLPTPDVTARVMEALVDCGAGAGHPAMRKALEFLRRTQCTNGAWWSRWWAGYLVGVSFVLRAYGKLGLVCGASPGDDSLLRASHEAMMRGVAFLLAHQNADGGWGESTGADGDIALAGKGASTPLRTAHIISSLLRTGHPATHPAISRAMGFLRETQGEDGRWHDRQADFSSIARCLYYQCDFLNLVLPLDALNDYLEVAQSR